MLTLFFDNRKAHFAAIKQQTERRLNRFVYARLVVALLLIGLVYMAVQDPNNRVGWVLALLTGLAFFLYLIARHQDTKVKWQHWSALEAINQAERAYTEGDLSAFEAGADFIDYDHPFTYSLDIFGEKSLFHHINRTTTPQGSALLSRWLAFTEGVAIEHQQKAIEALAQDVDFRQTFQAYGHQSNTRPPEMAAFYAWIAAPSSKGVSRWHLILAYIGAALSLSFLVAYVFTNNAMAWDGLKISCLVNIALVALRRADLQSEQQKLGHSTAFLAQYAQLLAHISTLEPVVPQLQELKSRLDGAAEGSASAAIRQLSSISQRFDLLHNPVASLLLNAFLQYHLHALKALADWHQRYAPHVPRWLETLAETDALCSVANFAHHQGTAAVFPTIAEKPIFKATAMAHPLLAAERRIGNDIVFDDNPFTVLTGSNMSGKSTFLRTLGVNLILARIGAPVCAQKCTVYPFDVYVSMRINDSLHNSESFFFAELKRLQQMLVQLDSTTPTFVILDEILRGTNSNDKRAGTQGLIHALARRQAVGIIATHDLVIGDMVETYPKYLKNACFEVNITPQGLEFDYKLRAGVCQKMSATYLMQQMKIIE